MENQKVEVLSFFITLKSHKWIASPWKKWKQIFGQMHLLKVKTILMYTTLHDPVWKIKQKSYMFDMYNLHKNDSETKLLIFSHYYDQHKICLFDRLTWADLEHPVSLQKL